MNQKQLLFQVRKELKANVDKKYKEGEIRFFKEKIRPYGVRHPVLRKIHKKHFQKSWTEKQVLELCEALLKTGVYEEGIIAFEWAHMKKLWEPKHLKVYERWFRKYVHNWSWCDNLCAMGALGKLFLDNPDLMQRTEKWARSKNLWVRRSAAVSLIMATRKKDITRQAFRTSGIMMYDKEDLVQKGVGWLLKETANNLKLRRRVLDFLLLHKDAPRTLLRYATEKIPREQKKHVLGWQ